MIYLKLSRLCFKNCSYVIKLYCLASFCDFLPFNFIDCSLFMNLSIFTALKRRYCLSFLIIDGRFANLEYWFFETLFNFSLLLFSVSKNFSICGIFHCSRQLSRYSSLNLNPSFSWLWVSKFKWSYDLNGEYSISSGT